MDVKRPSDAVANLPNNQKRHHVTHLPWPLTLNNRHTHHTCEHLHSEVPGFPAKLSRLALLLQVRRQLVRGTSAQFCGTSRPMCFAQTTRLSTTDPSMLLECWLRSILTLVDLCLGKTPRGLVARLCLRGDITRPHCQTKTLPLSH